MKIGEIWRYKLGIENLIQSDPDCYEPGDELVKINSFTFQMGYEGVVFNHMRSTCIGVLERTEFINQYERVYNEGG